MSRLAFLLLILTAACAGRPPKAPEDIRAIPSEFLESVSASRRGLTMRVYDTGSVATQEGAVSSIKSWASRITLEMPAFLVKHPKEGLILFDTGLHPDFETHPENRLGFFSRLLVPFKAERGQTLVSQLAADGVKPADVRLVVISHLHMDHTGAIDSFPNATVVIDRREWERNRKDDKIDWNSLEARVKIKLVDFAGSEPFGAFDHGQDLLGDGSATLIDMLGHTPGSIGLWLNLDSGPVLLAGDASWVMDNHRDLALPIKGHIFDVEQYWRRLHMMRAMQQALPDLVIYPGHDLAPFTLQPRKDVALVPFPR